MSIFRLALGFSPANLPPSKEVTFLGPGPIGVLFDCFAPKTDGDPWFTWWFYSIHNGHLFPLKGHMPIFRLNFLVEIKLGFALYPQKVKLTFLLGGRYSNHEP